MSGAGGVEVGRISIRVVPDTDRFRAELKAKLEAIEKSFKVTIPVDLDLDENGLRAKIRAATSGLDKTVKIKTDVDQADLARAVAAVNRLGGKKLNLKLGIDDQFDFRLRQRLAKIKPKVNVDLDVNQGALSRLGGGLFNVVSNLGSAAAQSASGILGMGRNLAIVAAVAAFVAPALALVAGTLVTLPALAAAVALPIAAIALGLDGIKAAAKTVQPEFDALKKTMSDTFQAGFTPLFENLKTTLFPLAQEVLPKVAQGVVNMAKGFSDAVTSAPGMEALKNTATNIGAALTNAAPGVKSFTDGLLVLVDKVSAKFPHLADQFSELGGKFAQWVTDFTTVDPSTGLSKLDTTLSNLKGTLGEVSGLLGDISKWSFDNISSPDFGAKMKDFAADLRSLVTDTLPAFEKSFTTVANAIDKISGAIDKLSWVGKIFGAFDSKGEGDKPFGQQDIGQKLFGGLGHNAQDQLKAWWSGANPQIPPEFDKGLQDSATKAGQDAQQKFQQGWTGGGGGSFDGGTAALTDGIKQQFSGEFQGILNEAQAKITALAPLIQQSTQAAITPLQQIPVQLAATFSQLAGAMSAAISPVIITVATAAQQMVTAFSGALAQLSGVTTSAFSGLTGAVQGTMSQVVAAVTTGGQQVVTELQTWPAKFQAAVGQLSGSLTSAGAALVQGLIDGINSRKAAAVAAATDVANAVAIAARGALGIHSPSKVFFDIGDNVGQGLADGIAGQSSSVIDTIKQILQAVKDVFGNASGLALNFNLGGQAGLQTQMSNVADSASSFQKSMTGSLPAVGKVSADTKAQVDQLSLQQQQLDVEKQQLQNQKNGTADKGLKAQLQQRIDALNLQRQQLDVDKLQMQNADKYSGQLDQQSQQYQELFKKAGQVPVDFAKATGQQFMQDLGMSGNGAIPTIGNQLLDWGSQFVFNVSNVDEAMAVQQNQQNKKSLQWTNRGA